MPKPVAWNTLSAKEQQNQLKAFKNADLAKAYGLTVPFFQQEREYYEGLPDTTEEPTAISHNPPKDLVISARRDLSFYEANFELFDNSIDKWRKMGAKRDLIITVEYDVNLAKGKYEDNAGGMDNDEVYKVFIPGETMNRNYRETVIGSFGMGAKKAIFRLTDGAKVVSCTNKNYSSTSEVPEKWEAVPNWETYDGTAQPTEIGKTEIYMFKLFNPPTRDELSELVARTGSVYKPLLNGDVTKKRIHISINNVDVKPAEDIPWSAPNGAEPRVYAFTHTFKNFLNTGNDINMSFRFKAGLSRRLPGKGKSTEPDWGVDVYGNGRLVHKYLKDEFKFGTRDMSKNTQANRYFRAELFIDGHSMGIPWDTHKREYLRDHPISTFLADRLFRCIKPFLTVAGRFANDTNLRTTVLEGTHFTGNAKENSLAPSGVPSESSAPKWTYGPAPKKSAKTKKNGNEQNQNSNGNDDDEGNESTDRVITIELGASEHDELIHRFNVDSDDELSSSVHDCLSSGVAFALDPAELEKAFDLLGVTDTGELSQRLKQQLLNKIHSTDKPKK